MADNLDDLAQLQARIQERFQKLEPQIRKALTIIGADLQKEIVLQLRSNRQWRGGILANSIRYNFVDGDADTTVLEVGSYGVKYAAINEFGYTFSPEKLKRMRRYWFARLARAENNVKRGKGKTIPKKYRMASKGRFSLSTGIYKASPFLRPAFLRYKNSILKVLQEQISKG
jgi:hypothetical protein